MEPLTFDQEEAEPPFEGQLTPDRRYRIDHSEMGCVHVVGQGRGRGGEGEPDPLRSAGCVAYLAPSCSATQPVLPPCLCACVTSA